MILVILLILEIILLFFYIINFLFIKKVISKSNFIFVFPLIILSFCIFLYSIYYSNNSLSFFDILYAIKNTFKLFAFQFETTYFIELYNNNIVFSFLFTINIILVCYTSFSVVLDLIMDQIKNMIYYIYIHFISFDCVIGNNDNSLQYAANNKNTILWIDSISKEDRQKFKNLGIKYICRKYTSENFKKIVGKNKKNISFILFYEDISRKLNVINQFHKFIMTNDKFLLTVSLHVMYDDCDEDLLNELYSIKNQSSPKIILFSKYELKANKFIFNYPMTKFMDERELNYQNGTIKDIKLVSIFIGFGKMNQELYIKSFVISQFLDENLQKKEVEFYAFDKKQNFSNKKFNYRLFNYSKNDSDNYFGKYNVNRIVFKSLDVNDIKFIEEILQLIKGNCFFNIFISYSNDVDNLDLAYKLNSIFKERHLTRYHIFAKMNSVDINVNDLSECKITIFGSDKEILNHNVIVNDLLNNFARNRTLNYINSSSKNNLDLMLNSWNSLPSLKRDSNISSTIAIRFFLNLIGLDITKGNMEGISKEEFNKIYLNNTKGNYKYSDYNFNELSPRNVLALLEHERWNHFYISNGYRPMKKEDVKVYFSSENHKYTIYKENTLEKTHACITSIDGLKNYHAYLAEIIKNSGYYELSYDDILNRVETFKYDIQLMEKCYDSLNENGFKIIFKSENLYIEETNDLETIYENYINDFPKNELLSKKVLQNHLKTKKYHLFLAKDYDLKAYFLVYQENQDFLWIDYFAVIKKYRSGGFGTKALKLLLSKASVILFEVEISDGIYNSQSSKRERFYKRLGAKIIDIPYELPTKEGSIRMNLFAISNKEIDNLKLKEFIKRAVKFIHSDKIHTNRVIEHYIDKI